MIGNSDNHLFRCLYISCIRYATIRIQKLEEAGRLTRHGRFTNWKDLTVPQFCGFLSIILNMGIIQLPEIEDYWKSNWISEIPFFGHVMPRDRFEQIFWMFHVSHSPTPHAPRKIDKIQQFLYHLIAKFQSSYLPGRNLAIDETMIGFRGRFGARQYMPQKPTKWGIKAFTMADSDNGYLLNVLVYTGRETLEESTTDTSLPQPARVVMHLIDPYLDKGHHLFTDRYYTSIPLADALKARSTAFTGTCNKNRMGLPAAIRGPLKLTHDEILPFRDGRLLCLAWRPCMEGCKAKNSSYYVEYRVILHGSDSKSPKQTLPPGSEATCSRYL